MWVHTYLVFGVCFVLFLIGWVWVFLACGPVFCIMESCLSVLVSWLKSSSWKQNLEDASVLRKGAFLSKGSWRRGEEDDSDVLFPCIPQWIVDYLETCSNSILCVGGFESVVRYYPNNMLNTSWESMRDCGYSVVYLFPAPSHNLASCSALHGVIHVLADKQNESESINLDD